MFNQPPASTKYGQKVKIKEYRKTSHIQSDQQRMLRGTILLYHLQMDERQNFERMLSDIYPLFPQAYMVSIMSQILSTFDLKTGRKRSLKSTM